MTQGSRGDSLEPIMRRMGEPSWLILCVLSPVEAIPGIDIIRRVESSLEAADYPYKHLDPSTLHYALRRMEDDGLVRCTGQRDVEVPGPRGSRRREARPVYVITGVGAGVLDRHQRLEAVLARRPWATRGVTPAFEGSA